MTRRRTDHTLRRAHEAALSLGSQGSSRLTIVQHSRASCGICGVPIGPTGTECRTWYAGYAHVSCVDGDLFAAKGGA